MPLFDQLHHAMADGHQKADHALYELKCQSDLLATIAENTAEAEYRDRVRRIPLTGIAVVGGVATVAIDAPQGVAWNLMSMAGDSAVSAAGVEVRVYLTSADPWNLIRVIRPTDTGRWSQDFPADEYVPQGGRIVIEWVGQGAQAVVNASIKVENMAQHNG